MRKKNIFFKLLILLGIIFIFSCNQNFFFPKDNTKDTGDQTVGGYGKIALSINNQTPDILTQISPIGMRKFNTRTIFPDLSADDIKEYQIIGSGAGSLDLTTDVTGVWTSPDLSVGLWTITVKGKNISGDIIADGTTDVTVAANTTATANVNVAFLQSATGGTLDLSIDWPVGITADKIGYSTDGGSYYNDELPTTVNSFKKVFSPFPSGSYDFVIKIMNGTTTLAVLMETVYIYDNTTTYWPKTLSINEINAPPSAPTGLTITEGSGKLVLNWNDISDVETGYKIYRKIGAGSYMLLVDLPASAVGYEDNSAASGDLISYQITAYNDFGESAPLEASYALVTPIVSEALIPADEATDVDVTTDIKIRFSKSMDTSVIGEIKIYDGSSDQTLTSANAYFVFSTTVIPNDTLTIISKSPAPYGIACSNIRVNGFKDVFGTSTAYTIPDYNFKFKAAPPKFALGYPRINTITENSFCIDAISDTTGKVYYKILTAGSTQPTASDVYSSGDGSYDVTANTLSRKVVTSVSANQEYDVYIICADASANLSSVFKFMVKTSLTNDILFSENFEDEAAPWTPGEKLYIPSGNAKSDWDNSIFYPTNILASKITDIPMGINSSKMFLINKSFPTVTPSLLGASFNEATKRYAVVEYDFYTPTVGLTIPVCHIIASDGTADLNGTGANSIAVHIKVDATAIGSERIKYVTEEDSDLIGTPDGSTITIFPNITWTNLIWYRMQLVLDQSDNSVDIKLLNKNVNSVYTAVGLPYNNSSAGNIKKVWFGTSNTSELYIDNILIYQTNTDPNVSAPTIILNKKGSGPVRQNPFIDVDFIGSVDLSSIEYKIGELGPYAPLTTDGTTPVSLSATKIYDTPVKISDASFNAMPEGEKRIYFKVTDVSINSTESVEYFTIIKDTMPPQIKTATIAPDNSFVKLDFSEKVWGDIAMLQAIDTGDLAIAFHHAGSIIDATIDGLYANPALTEPLAGGNGYETVFVQISPVPFDNKPDGTETFSIKSGANMIFDRVGNSGPETTSAIMTFNDKKPPTIVYKSPENSVKAGLDSDLIFTFDEAVNANAGKYIYIKKISDNSTFRSFLATDDTKVVITANQVKLIVDGYFEPNTDYYVTMDAGAFKDLKGNYFAGLSDTTKWNWTTSGLYTEMVFVEGVNDSSYYQKRTDTDKFIHNISDFYVGKYEVTYQLW
nr:Ig-like domain-containing protein [Spirochaetota bacterium]